MQDLIKNKTGISDALNICLQQKVHFVAYRLPGEYHASLIIQKEPSVRVIGKLNQKLPQKGFLIAPFSRETEEAWLVKPDILLREPFDDDQLERLDSIRGNSLSHSENSYPRETEKSEYIRLIRDSVNKIKSGEFDKVVLSRVKSVSGNFRSRLPQLFIELCKAYPHAFVYLFNINGQCWTGATPEPFICSIKGEIRTVSLAGTRPYNEDDLDISRWNNKELQEQEYVTLHIEKILDGFHINTFRKNGPYVTKAGNLLHLRTDFTFSADSVGNRLPALIAALHPTPAVCGMSTGEAMDFIRNSEKHSRGYYAGFLGPVGISEHFSLYVNLRCMRVYDDRLILYIGGGITMESVPEDEWEETEIKADTLLSVLKQVR
ncbi:MAG TPA: chorismate-binding protein [Bacteroidales bacterium]|jgi:isochorismate synthase|nr:chorismate-binding protein [Bacteroidales bacterium]